MTKNRLTKTQIIKNGELHAVCCSYNEAANPRAANVRAWLSAAAITDTCPHCKHHDAKCHYIVQLTKFDLHLMVSM